MMNELTEKKIKKLKYFVFTWSNLGFLVFGEFLHITFTWGKIKLLGLFVCLF